MLRSLMIAGLLLATVPVGTAAAQDEGRVGLVMGYPGSVGVLWQVSDRVAIRPEVAFGRTSAENTSSSGSTTSTSNAWSTTIGISALYYLAEIDEGLRTYVSPRFYYGRNSSETRQELPTFDTYRGESTTNTYTVAGSFGAEYALGKRFALFGEVGLMYGRGNASGTQESPGGTTSKGKTTSNNFGTRSAVGVVLFF